MTPSRGMKNTLTNAQPRRNAIVLLNRSADEAKGNIQQAPMITTERSAAIGLGNSGPSLMNCGELLLTTHFYHEPFHAPRLLL
jgi:hypothetical protein